MDKQSKSILQADCGSTSSSIDDEDIVKALEVVANTAAFTPPSTPVSVTKQLDVVNELLEQYSSMDIVVNNEEEIVIESLKYIAALRDPISFLKPNKNNDNDNNNGTEIYAWRLFLQSVQILQSFNALDSEMKPTELGDMVSSITADNELWIALVLLNPKVQLLNEADLGAIICGAVIDGYKSSNSFFRTKPSAALQV